MTTSRAAVFHGAGEPLQFEEFELPSRPAPGELLCRVRMSTICGSDLHTIHGRRQEPTPLVLGHEIIGEVEQLGDGIDRDGYGQPLRVGDRVSWSIAASCGACFYCDHALPQKCDDLRKYGHLSSVESPSLTGGFAEHVVILPGTAVFKVPDRLTDAIAAPANCALATVVHGITAIGLTQGETVLIQGAGLLGLNLCALACERGAESVIVVDRSAARLELAKKFGAHHVLDASELAHESLVGAVRDLTSGRGADVAFEVCGAKEAIPVGLDALRIGGRYLITMVTPGNAVELDGNTLTRRCLTLHGIHNYTGEHLGEALRFLESVAEHYPYDEIVGRTFALDDIEEAVVVASSGQYVRVGVTP